MKEESKRPQLKKTRLEFIKEAIPLIENLHPSFWENPRFLGWQLLRLNENYQKDVDFLWNKLRRWFESNRQQKEESLSDYEIIQNDFLPHPNQTFKDWDKALHLIGATSFIGYVIIDPEAKTNNDTDLHWLGPISKIVLNPDGNSFDIEIIRSGRKEKMVFSPGKLKSYRPPPIPWTVRFPSPSNLNEIPPWPKKGKTIRGRPQNWGKNLIVYELSQAEMRDMEIARLLFGIEKSTEFYPQKDPILVRINTMKETVKKAVSQVYPLT